MSESGKKRTRYGAPPPKGLEARKNSGQVCSARRTNGSPCANFAITGANVCRIHGGSAPQVRAKAQVRILMASDLAASKLIELLSSPKVADNIKLAAAKDLLDRANLAGTQNIEVGITKRTFEDFIGDALVDFEVSDEDLDGVEVSAKASQIIDAEVVEDDALEAAPTTRGDRAHNRDRQRARRAKQDRRTSSRVDPAELEALDRNGDRDAAESRARVGRGREAYLTALNNGATPDEASSAAAYAAERKEHPNRQRGRTSRAQMG